MSDHLTKENLLEISDEEFIAEVEKVKKEFPKNRMAKFFDEKYYLSLSDADKKRFRKIVIPGIMSAESSIGIYVQNPKDYVNFSDYLYPLIADYHGVDLNNYTHKNDWDLAGKSYDISALGFENVSIRVRVAGVPQGVNLPAAMDQAERVSHENNMVEVFQKVIEKSGGKYVSLTPGSDYLIDEAEYQSYVNKHQMFKNMIEDPHLKVTDLAGDWPYGRGMYIHEGETTYIVWVGEEDPLRIMTMKMGSELSELFNDLKKFLDEMKECGLELYEDAKIGVPASCPSNIGTAMRFSIHAELPEGVNFADFEKKVEEYNATVVAEDANEANPRARTLQVRGSDGETSSKDSRVVDLSPYARLGGTQADVVKNLYNGLERVSQSLVA